MKDFNLEPTEYPALFYPETVLQILKETPPEPSLKLVSLPSKPVKSEITRPSFDKLPPQRINYSLVGTSVAIALVLMTIAMSSGGVGGFFLFLLTTLGIAGVAGAFVWYWQNYPERLDDYRREKLKHQHALEDFQKKLRVVENDYQLLLKEHEKRCKESELRNEVIRDEHRRICAELKKPEAIEDWRNSRLTSVDFCSTELGEYVNTNDFDPRGFAEFEANSDLPGLLRHYFGDKIHVLRYVSGRIPDFAYVDILDEFSRLSIDIEIDEPYTPRQYPNSDIPLKITHCLGQNEYDYRTQTFQSSDWFVLFFSERQALHSPRECCKTVAQLIDKITGSQLVATQFKGVKDLVPEPRWTEAEARAMAKRRERLNYRRSHNYSYSNQRLLKDVLLEISQTSSGTPSQSENLTSSASVSTIPDRKAKQLMRRKYKCFLKDRPELQPDRITAQKFLEDLIHPSKTGQVSHWVRVKGVPEALKFLEDYKPEFEESIELM